MKKYSLLILFVGILLLGIYFLSTSYRTNKSPNLSVKKESNDKSKILDQCVGPKDEQNHYDVILHISYLGQNYPIPENIGIENGCMHHLVTHDSTSGMIHAHFAQYYPFTLGDFFTIWGKTFNRNQVGEIIAGNKYIFTLSVNGKENTDYENYKLVPNDNINLVIVEKKN